jgi:hypothetical protein
LSDCGSPPMTVPGSVSLLPFRSQSRT